MKLNIIKNNYDFGLQSLIVIHMNNLDFDDIFSGEPAPEKIRLNRRALHNFKKIGGKGLAIIISDDEWGPIVRYYYLKRSRIVSKLLENKSLPVELSIAGKYAEELIMKDGSKIIIFSYETPSKIYDRKKINYIIVEVFPNIDAEKLTPIITKLKREISKMDSPDRSLLSKILTQILSKKNNNS